MNGIVLAVLSFVFTPLYTNLIGVENYAIINIWMVTIVIVSLFDLGINLTLNNSLSIEGNKGIKQKIFKTLEKKILVRALYILITISLLLFFFFNQSIINSQSFKQYILIAFSAIFQFIYQFYFNAFLGIQEHKKVNSYNISFNLLKFVFGYIILLYTLDLLCFLFFQMILSAIQFFFLKVKSSKKILIKSSIKKYDNIEMPKLSNYTRELTILSLSSITLAHIDRLWIYSYDDLYAYGNYAIAFVGASIIQLIIQPFYKTFFSKYSELYNTSSNNFYNVFISSTILCASFLTIASVNLIFFSENILNFWLGEINSVSITNNFVMLTLGITLCGFFWLPAAFMQAQKLPKFHNKMILLAIILSTFAYLLDQLNVINVSPTIVWFLHGITLFIFETYYLYKNFIGNKIFNILFTEFYFHF